MTSSLARLGALYAHAGRENEAETAYRRAISLCREMKGDQEKMFH